MFDDLSMTSCNSVTITNPQYWPPSPTLPLSAAIQANVTRSFHRYRSETPKPSEHHRRCSPDGNTPLMCTCWANGCSLVFQQQTMFARDAIYPLSVYHRLFCCSDWLAVTAPRPAIAMEGSSAIASRRYGCRLHHHAGDDDDHLANPVFDEHERIAARDTLRAWLRST